MAEAASWMSTVPCRFYAYGCCLKSEQCPYLHDTNVKVQKAVCLYYKQGECRYGNECRLLHSTADDSTELSKSADSMPETNTKLTTTKAKSSSSNPRAGNFTKLSKKGKNSISDKKSSDAPTKNTSNTGGHKPSSSIVESSSTDCSSSVMDKWVHAQTFVPGQAWKAYSTPNSYLEAVTRNLDSTHLSEADPAMIGDDGVKIPDKLCPWTECPDREKCAYVHADLCELCMTYVLDPNDKEQQENHRKECMEIHEHAMELSFAVQRSENKACGICMEVILDKNPPSERKFGILSDCNHIFCLECIRKWRCAKQFDNKIVRACPECRVSSNFVTPSKYWIEDKEEKEKLISGYKNTLKTKKCKYFDEGRGDCPFNENCFYKHAYPDGRPASPKPNQRRRRENCDGELIVLHEPYLWDFLNETNASLSQVDELYELILEAMVLQYDSD